MLDETEQYIADTLSQFTREYFTQNNRSGVFITNAIKELIGKYGQSKGHTVCTSGFRDVFEGGWLYDMTWYKVDETGKLCSVELVLESELAYGFASIQYDFEKLLLANAKHRVMICVAGNKITVEEIKNYFSNAVKAYTLLNQGDRILTLIWDDYGTGEIYPHLIIK